MSTFKATSVCAVGECIIINKVSVLIVTVFSSVVTFCTKPAFTITRDVNLSAAFVLFS